MAEIRILGISLGTRTLGMVILQGTTVFESQMKVFNRKWSREKLLSILLVIKSYIINYRVGCLVLKVPTSADTLRLDTLQKEILSLCGQLKIAQKVYTLNDIKKHWLNTTRCNRSQLLECVVGKYPELNPEYSKEIKNRTKHYFKLFEAVGAIDLYINGG